jgi:phosphatidylserine decarboxylase
MFQMFNLAIADAPVYSNEHLVGRPVNAVIANCMQTASGRAIFNDKVINTYFKSMFEVWKVVLSTDLSQHVLNQETGWLCTDSLNRLTIPRPDDPNPDDPTDPLQFTDAYACDTSDKYFGFKSWDEFFVRKLKNDSIRPLPGPKTDNSLITCACESHLYRVAGNVKLNDQFWIKDKAYSLQEIFDDDVESAKKFVDGTIFQTYLSPRDYHHWHSPVKGIVVKTVKVQGTYYSTYSSEEYDPAPNEQSVGLLPHVATRALIYIKPDNDKIGNLVCFIGIGMFEVSSCDIVVQVGQPVNNGDDLGMFHFGGSSHCLVFQKEAKVDHNWGTNYTDPKKTKLVKVNSSIATVKKN